MNATKTEATAYCASCGKHWPAAVIEDGTCWMCSDMDDDE